MRDAGFWAWDGCAASALRQRVSPGRRFALSPPHSPFLFHQLPSCWRPSALSWPFASLLAVRDACGGSRGSWAHGIAGLLLVWHRLAADAALLCSAEECGADTTAMLACEGGGDGCCGCVATAVGGLGGLGGLGGAGAMRRGCWDTDSDASAVMLAGVSATAAASAATVFKCVQRHDNGKRRQPLRRPALTETRSRQWNGIVNYTFLTVARAWRPCVVGASSARC